MEQTNLDPRSYTIWDKVPNFSHLPIVWSELEVTVFLAVARIL